MNADVCAAIRTRRRLAFEYDGHPRVVEPYCHGTTRRGNEAVRALQVGGVSSSGRRSFNLGKLWTLAKTKNLRVTAERFVPDDPDYNPDDSAFEHIHCRIEPD